MLLREGGLLRESTATGGHRWSEYKEHSDNFTITPSITLCNIVVRLSKRLKIDKGQFTSPVLKLPLWGVYWDIQTKGYLNDNGSNICKTKLTGS